MAALKIFVRRTTQLRWCREITIKNTCCLQCQCGLHSYSSWTNNKYSTQLYLAPLNRLGFEKNAFARYLLFNRQTCSKTNESLLNLTEDSCPQGIQGDDCTTFKIWMENCQRYGLENCQDQLQGVQSGRKTLSEVFAEQNKLIEEIAEQYRMSHAQDSSHVNSSLPDRGSIQGCQDMVTAFPSIDTPCPQGVQGSDCARFKMWLENCHRFGFGNCTEQYKSYKEGRKTLAQIFDEQDKIIREVASIVNVKNLKNTRDYSTVAGPDKNKEEPTPETD
ncbi:hypothetical protein Btru_077854 [Bulinus truncatus]|nr:hypothetical protein Btru_077854 [Bulinus truncatus]